MWEKKVNKQKATLYIVLFPLVRERPYRKRMKLQGMYPRLFFLGNMGVDRGGGAACSWKKQRVTGLPA